MSNNINFTFKESGAEVSINTQHIIHANYEDESIFFTLDVAIKSLTKVSTEYLLKDEHIVESICDVWRQVQGKPDIISFTYINQDKGENAKIIHQADTILAFQWNDHDEIIISFDRQRLNTDAFPLTTVLTTVDILEPLQYVWEQLCRANRIEVQSHPQYQEEE